MPAFQKKSISLIEMRSIRKFIMNTRGFRSIIFCLVLFKTRIFSTDGNINKSERRFCTLALSCFLESYNFKDETFWPVIFPN